VDRGREITAVLDPAAGPAPAAVFVCAHGAGGHLADRGLLQVAAALRGRGLSVVRFNFPYAEAGSRRPDPMPTLTRAVAAVAGRVTQELEPKLLILGGRSMGGRAASLLAADGFPCDALLLLAYPLHPANRPDRLREAHLPAIRVPVLCFNGTRDALCRRDLMERTLERLGPGWTMHWLEGADHGFHVLKASGRTDAAVLEEIAAVTEGWVSRLVPAAA